jgi:hypothetical protein
MPPTRRDTTSAHRRLTLLALGVALGLGVAGRVAIHAGGHLPHGEALAALGRALVALGGPWLAAAWTIGALAGSRARGALGGGAALALGTGAWYLLTVAAGGRAADAVPVAAAWAAVALAAGALFGLAGASWRDGQPRVRAAAVAMLAGALAGEALLLAGEWAGRAAAVVLAVELASGLGLLAAARRRTPLLLTLAVFAVAAVSFAGIEDAVRDTLRLAGWAGP